MTSHSSFRVFLLMFSLVLMISSQFVQMFGGFSTIELIQVNLLFLLPLVSSVLLFFGLLILLYLEYRKYSRNLFMICIVILAVSLLMDMQFIIFLITNHSPYVWSSEGIYFNLFGFVSAFLSIIFVSSSPNPES